MVDETNTAAIDRFGIATRVYLQVPIAGKDIAKAAGARFDFDLKLWYSTSGKLNETLKRYPVVAADRDQLIIKELVGENRMFGDNCLSVDLTPFIAGFKGFATLCCISCELQI